eukprot:CAMPEP_0198647628 /NCGR_PEP_ID=MMETSP1467-20131203/2866_1 /TAXON_ID=1462469 /ORGANISM="unid. sp., Strain CCMP2135" /LENGTH=85 /DNA_ID=CAMNT_0044383279 /DNA_START=28 /DNA_END=285 /DNA_ORIENTATION=+
MSTQSSSSSPPQSPSPSATVSLAFRRTPESLGDEVLRLRANAGARPTVTTKEATLRLAMRRPTAALGHYLGLRSVQLYGSALGDM